MDKLTLIVLTADPDQAHRIKRYLMAVGTSLLVLLLMILLYRRNQLDGDGLVHCAAAMGFFFLLFYLLFRTRLNLRSPEPSLTAEQMVSGILVLTYAMFHATSEGRSLLLLAYLLTFLFGIFRLGAQQLFAIAALAAVAYGLAIAALLRYRPANMDLETELLRWSVAAAVLFWFALMGGYIGRMRKQLSDFDRGRGAPSRRTLRGHRQARRRGAVSGQGRRAQPSRVRNRVQTQVSVKSPRSADGG